MVERTGTILSRAMPENFDDLVLVFIHPDYIEIRHLTSRRASDMVNNSGCLNVKSPFIKGLEVYLCTSLIKNCY